MNRTQTTLSLLRTGWTTALESATSGGVWSLSQRVGVFKRQGIDVIDKWVITTGGSLVKAYRVVPEGETSAWPFLG